MNSFNAGVKSQVWIIKSSAESLAYDPLWNRLVSGDRQYCYRIQQCESDLEISLAEPSADLPSCILLDWELGDRQAEKILQQLSRDSLPIIILVEKSNEATIIALAKDYLIKETLTPEFLDYAVHQAIAKTKLKQQLAETEAKNKLLKQKIQLEQAINLLIQSIHSTFDLPSILTAATTGVGKLLKLDRVEITQYLPQQGIWTPIVEYRDNPTVPSAIGMIIPDQDNLISFRLKQGEIVCVNSSAKIDSEINWVLAAEYPGSWLIAPLVIGDVVWGVISMDSHFQERCWQDMEIDLASNIATQIAIAIQQSQSHHNLSIELQHRAQANLELQEQESLLKAIFESPTVGIVITDATGKFMRTNSSYQHMVGYSGIELESMNFSAFTYPEDLPENYKRFMSVVRGEQNSFSIEKRYYHRNGSYLWVRVNCFKIDVPSGNPQLFIALIEDINDRKSVEIDLEQLNQQLEFKIKERTSALQDSETRFKSFFDFAPIGIAVADLQTYQFVGVNHNFCQLLGYTEHELLGLGSCLTVSDVADWELERPYAESMIRGEVNSYQISKRYIKKNGEYILGELTATLIRDKNGSATHIVGMVRDITNQKETELALAESTKLIRQIANASPNILYVYDVQEQRNIYANREILSTLGYTSQHIDEMGSGPFSHLMHPDDLDGLDSRFEQINVLKDGEILEIDYRVRDVEGQWQWFNSRNSVFTRSGNQVSLIIGAAQNITDRKLAEIQLQQQAELQRLVVGVTHRIRASLNLTEIIETTVSEIRQLLECDRALVYKIFANGTGAAVAESISANCESILYQVYAKEVFPEEIYGSYLKGKVYALNDFETEPILPCLVEFLKTMQVRSKLVVPIIQSHRLWGLLILHQCDRPRAWQPWEKDLLQQLTGQLAIAIQQANLFELVQHQLREQKLAEKLIRQQASRETLLKELTQQMRQSLDLELILSTAVNEVRTLLNCDRVIIFQLFEDGVTKVVKEAVSSDYPTIINRYWLDEHFTKVGFNFYIKSTTRIVNDVSQDTWANCLSEFMQEAQVKSKIVTPIIQHIKAGQDRDSNHTYRWQKDDSKLWGLLIAHSCGEMRQWQLEEAELLQQIANQLAIAIQQANLYQQVQNELAVRRQFEQELETRAGADRLLSEVTVAINQSVNVDEALDLILKKVREFLKCDRVQIFQLDNNFEGCVIKEEVSRPDLAILGTMINDACFATTTLVTEYLQGKMTILSDVLTEPNLTPCYADLLKKYQVRANLAAPIIQSKKLWGLLLVHQCDSPRVWLSAEVNLVKQVAAQIGISAQKEKLYVQLTSELNQKKVLLKEIHHRVKNNLQIMSSLLRMQFRKSTPEVKLLAEEYQSRIQSMAIIHDQLYRSDNLSHIDFHRYISNLTANLFQCYGASLTSVQSNLEVNNIMLPLDQAIPLGLIINELVSNALKYAFPLGVGKINIQLSKSAQQCSLIVSDDGIGISAEFDLVRADSLGLQLVKNLTQQLEGELSFNGVSGSTFQINFPIA